MPASTAHRWPARAAATPQIQHPPTEAKRQERQPRRGDLSPCTSRSAVIGAGANAARSTPNAATALIASALRNPPHTLSVASAVRLDQRHRAPSPRDHGGCRGAAGPAADDHRSCHCGSRHRRATAEANGRCQVYRDIGRVSPAVRSDGAIRRRTKLRAIEMRPSLRTKGCQRQPCKQTEAVYGNQCRCRSPMNSRAAHAPPSSG